MTLSEDEIRDLYQDETFPGSFAGAKVFQQFLKTEKNENVSLKNIYKVLKSLPNYMYTLKPMRRFPRRKYDVKSYLELVQCDLGQMYEFNDMKFFLLATDVFSSRIWCEPLRSKGIIRFKLLPKSKNFITLVNLKILLIKNIYVDKTTVRKAFDKIFEEMGQMPTHISTDQVCIYIYSYSSFFYYYNTTLTYR